MDWVYSGLIKNAELAHCTAPIGSAVFKCFAEDFRVDEILGFLPTDTGQHLFLEIEKRDISTISLLQTLIHRSQFPRKCFGYSGLKDRKAVAVQWISVDLSGRISPNWRLLLPRGCRLLSERRHQRKLQVGTHRSNRFEVTLRNPLMNNQAIAERLDLIGRRGVPNYFGPQRFGRAFGNVEKARQMFEGKRIRCHWRRSLYLSSVRALLFNRVLHSRVREGTWNKALIGDLMSLDGTRSFFQATCVDASTSARVLVFDIHPTGPLCGVNEHQPVFEAGLVESRALKNMDWWIDGLRAENIEGKRRALRLKVQQLSASYESDLVKVRFELEKGGYATSVIRELFYV